MDTSESNHDFAITQSILDLTDANISPAASPDEWESVRPGSVDICPGDVDAADFSLTGVIDITDALA